MNKILIYIIGVLFLFGCAEKALFTSQKVESSTILTPESLIYSLPQTSITINIEVVNHIQTTGPYSQWAEEFLNIRTAMQNDSSWYQISKLTVNDFLETDPEHYYNITLNDKHVNLDGILKLTKEGLIVAPDIYNSSQNYNFITHDHDLHPYTDYSVKRNIVLERETYYQIEYKDSLYVKTPLWKDQLRAKDLKEKAEEAAKFIIKTRKRRFKLLAGQYDHFPKGDALEVSVRELNKTEEKYLSLFIGKRYRDTLNYQFTITPQTDDYSNYIVTYFSAKNGITNSDLSGDPIIMTLLPSEKIKNLEKLTLDESGNENSAIIHYRIPDKVKYDISLQNKSILEGTFLIHQYGKVLTMPVW